jgi:hypothetical protein
LIVPFREDYGSFEREILEQGEVFFDASLGLLV